MRRYGLHMVLFVTTPLWANEGVTWLKDEWMSLLVLIAVISVIVAYSFSLKRSKEVDNRRKLQQELAQYVELMDKYVITSSTDLEGVITQASEAFCEISKYSKEELLGQKHGILRHPDMPDSLYKGMWGTIKKGKVWKGELKNRAKDGSIYWVKAYVSPRYNEWNQIIGYISIREDITARKEVEKLSITDALTELYNRRYFDEVLPDEINRAKRKNHMVTFMLLDIDHFKQYNDTYGHQKGDEALQAVSKVLLADLHRAGDYAFRLGGEEFGILLNEQDEQDSLAFAEKLRNDIKALQIPHMTSETSAYLTVSLGLTCKEAKAIDSQDVLYKMTDDLLYAAKSAGRDCIKTNF